MISGLFSQLANAFQSSFSRAFWFASFMPVAMATTMHIIIAGLAFPAFVPLKEWLEAGASSLGIIPLIAAGVFVLAYAIGPLTSVALGFLDASRTPVWFQEALRKGRLKEAYKARLEIEQAKECLTGYQRMRETGVTSMIAARKTGINAGNYPTPEVCKAAVAMVRKIVNQIERGGLPSAQDTDEALTSLIAALGTSAAQATGPDVATAKSLTEAQDSLAVALIRGEAEAEHQLLLKKQRHGSLGAMTPPEATRMGDARQAAELYSHQVYSIRFEYIWPRLWLVMSEKDDFGASVSNAQTQVDFAVISTCMTALVVIVWVPVLTVFSTSPWLLLGVAGIGALMCGLFYELAVAGQWALVHVVKAAIDRYHLELLKVLYQPLPATRAAERQIWQVLEADDNAPGTGDIAYRYHA